MSVEYLDLLTYLQIAEKVTGIRAEVLKKSDRIGLADSALHAPQAGFGDEDFYPSLFDKAAVLCCRLAQNHPLPDGNKRSAWVSLTTFVDLNGGTWSPAVPDTDEAEQAMVALAAGTADEDWMAAWLRERLDFGH